MSIELLIENGSTLYTPVVKDEIHWITERKGAPGKITFSVVQDSALKIEEGNPVMLKVNGEQIFYGFLFKQSRNKNPDLSLTAYDQMRYLKNKDTYVFERITAKDVIEMIANDYGLQLGEIEYTNYWIPSRIEENSTLLDMMQTSLDITLTNTGNMYVLYDKAGKLTLTAAERMVVGLVIDAETGENFDYTSSIDDQTYNRIKLVYEDSESGRREIFTAQDKEGTMKKWGTLQYYEAISDTQNAQNKANALLSLYNSKTKKLKITALGDVRVRAGSYVVVRLNIGDVTLDNFMMVEKCDHKFKDNEHTMTLTLRGGEFVA